MKLFKREPSEPEPLHDYALQDVLDTAAQGRRLAIYDRATNLYAYWYLQLRATEEVSRSQRHGKGVFCISLWAPTPDAIQQLTTRLQNDLRDHDLAAYLNNGHFVALLTETDHAGAAIVLHRLVAEAPGATAGVAAFPADGKTFEELLECAKSRASETAAEDAA